MRTHKALTLLLLATILLVISQAKIVSQNDDSALAEAVTAILDQAESDAASASITVTVDSASANEFWIQLNVAPPKLVSSIQVVHNGASYNVPNVDWDKGNGAHFTGKPSSKIPFGSSVTAKLLLRTGATVNVPLVWKLGYAATAGSTTTTTNPTNPPSNGNHGLGMPSSNDAQIQSTIRQVANFQRSGSGPTAQITGDDTLRKKNKLALRDAMEQLAVNDLKTRAFLFAAFGLESEHMYDWNGQAQRDAAKDHDRLAKNVSPLNMNVDMLNMIGYTGNPDALNDLANIKLTVKVAMQAIDKLTLEGFLNFHRGGRTAYQMGSAANARFKIPEYKDGLYNIMQKYVQDPTLFNDGRKVWAEIPYV